VQSSVERVASSFARDPRARELYDQARFIVRGLDLARYAHARELLHEALRLDGRFARAHLVLGLLETNLVAHAATDTARSVAQARHHVQRAVELDAGLGSAHAMLGWIAMNHDLDWAAAEAHYRMALAASAGDVVVRNGWANFLCYTGRFAEADDEYVQARELDPLHVVPRINRALMLFFARDYDRSLAQYEEVQAMDPRQAGVNVIASIHLLRGEAGKALDAADEIVARFPELPIGHCRKAEALAAAGRASEARATFAAIEDALRQAGVASWARAHLAAVQRDHDAAFEHLAQAAKAREANFCTAAVTPYFASMHADPRWTRLVDACSLPKVPAGAWSGGTRSRGPN
jgi:tetratricopeptide (TPR) repeat protein